MAKLPQLSSLTPSVTPQLRGPLTLPTNFKAPVNPPGVSKALAAIAGTAADIGQFKQNLFEREQVAYSKSARNQAFALGEDLFLKNKQNIEDAIKDKNVNLRYGDGDAFLKDAVTNSFSDDFFNSLEGFSSLTIKNQESLKSEVYNSFLVRAAQQDNALRGVGRSITERTNYDNDRLDLASTSPSFVVNEKGELEVDANFTNLSKSIFAYSIDKNLSQKDRDQLGNDIISKVLTPETEAVYLGEEGLAQFKQVKNAVLKLLSNESGQSLVTQSVLARLDNYQRQITTGAGKYKTAQGKASWSDWMATAQQGDAADNSIFNNNQVLSRATALDTSGDSLLKTYGSDILTDTERNEVERIKRLRFASGFIDQVVRQENLPEDYGSKEEDRDLYFSNAQKALKESSVVGKLHMLSQYLTEKISLIDPKVIGKGRDSDEAIELRNLEKTLSLTEDYLDNVDAQTILDDRFAPYQFPSLERNQTLYEYLKVFQEAVSIDSNYDAETLKMPRQYLTRASDHLNYIRTLDNIQLNEFYKQSGFDLKTVEAFRTATVNNLDPRTRLLSIHGIDFGEEINDVPSRWPSAYINDTPRDFSIRMTGPNIGPVTEQDHAKLVSQIDASLQENRTYLKLIDQVEKESDTDIKRSKKAKVQKMLYEQVAKVLNRTYVENVGYLPYLMVNKKAFPENAKNIGGIIDVGSATISNLAFGNAGSVIDEIKNQPTETSVTGVGGLSGVQRFSSIDPQTLVDKIENADWTGSHDTIKAGAIAAVKEGAKINVTSAVLKLEQYVEALRNSTTISVDSLGNLYYKFRPEHGNTIISPSMSLNSLTALIGKEGMQNVRNRERGKIGRYLLGGFETEDPLESQMDLDVALDINIQSAVDVKEYSLNLMDNTNWEDSAQIGYEESANGVVQRLNDGDFVTVRITGDVAEKLDFKNSAAANDRVHASDKHRNLQNSHLLGRMFGIIIGANATQLDVPANLTSASIAMNQQAMRPKELAMVKDVEDYIRENDVSNLEAEWVIVSYQPELAAIEKGSFLDVSQGVKTPTITALQSRLQFKNKDTGKVEQTWQFEVQDNETFKLMAKSQMFLRN